MANANFQHLLSTPVDSVEKPKPLPTGTYQGLIKSFEFLEAKNDKKTPYVRFMLAFHTPGADIDTDELGKALGEKKLGDITKSKDFYLTPDAMWRLKDLIVALGIDTAGRGFDSTIPECVNQPVLIEVGQRNSPNGEEIFNDINKLGAVS